MDKYTINLNNYDYIIPFGEECYTCESIDAKFNNNKLRNCSFPFDYVGHTFIETLTSKVKNIMEPEYLLSVADVDIKLFDKNYFYIDKKYNLYYWHDTTHTNLNEFTDDELFLFLEKYNRRYDRLKSVLLNNNKKILLISVNHFDNIYSNIYKKKELFELYEVVQKINKNISLLAFNYDETNYNFDNLYNINLDINYSVPFEKSKILFKKTLFNYFVNHEIN